MILGDKAFSLKETMDKYDSIEALYMPWHGQKQSCYKISEASGGSVYYLGAFVGFGPVWAKQRLWRWKKCPELRPITPTANLRSLAFQEKTLDKTLADLKDCVVMSTTPSYLSQFQNACLLKSRGFQLLEDSCYRHPGYTALSTYDPEHPGIPDRYLHWEHIWWKVIGSPREIGVPGLMNQMNNCGIDSRGGLADIEGHNNSDRRNYLTVGWLARGTPFPEGWKRFFSAADYKLGHNLPLISKNSKVQVCDHNFNLDIFKDWEPDFEKWSPS